MAQTKSTDMVDEVLLAQLLNMNANCVYEETRIDLVWKRIWEAALVEGELPNFPKNKMSTQHTMALLKREHKFTIVIHHLIARINHLLATTADELGDSTVMDRECDGVDGNTQERYRFVESRARTSLKDDVLIYQCLAYALRFKQYMVDQDFEYRRSNLEFWSCGPAPGPSFPKRSP